MMHIATDKRSAHKSITKGIGTGPLCPLLLAAILFGALSLPSFAQEESSRVRDWTAIRGVNFIPGYARNAYETWTRYDAMATARELGFAKRLGFNSVRLWLHSDAYSANPDDFLNSLADCLDSCHRLGLTAMPVLFDSCGIEPQQDHKVLPLRRVFEEIRRRAGDDLQKEHLQTYGKGIAQDLAPDVLVPFGGNPGVLFWEWWRPNPGTSRCLPKDYPRLDEYTRAVIERFDTHPAVLAWDIHNEPIVAGPVADFVRHVCTYAKSMDLTKPITIGSAGTRATEAFAENVDLLSFHTYHTGDRLMADFAEARRISREHGNKPTLLTECLANTVFVPPAKADLSRDDGQLAHYRENLPKILESGFGWYSWGLVVGNLFATSCDIVYPNGFKRPAAAYLQAMLDGDTETASLFKPRVESVPDEFAGDVLVSPEEKSLDVEGKTHWRRLRAVNFIPSYSRTAIETWRNYDAEVVDRELGFTKSLGFNGVRAWLHERAYAQDPREFLDHVEDFLTRCDAHGLYVIVVLFDQCGYEYPLDGVAPISWGAKVACHESQPKDAQWIETFKTTTGKNWPALLALSRDMVVPHTTPPGILWPQWWYPNPGPSRLGEESWPAMAAYAEALVDRFGRHPRVIAWDALNEPGGLPAYQAFGKRMAKYVRSMQPSAPVTIGAASLENARRYIDDVDLISFHSYETGENLASRLAEARELGNQAGKEIIVSECLANFPTPDWYGGTDWGQLAHYRRTLPILAQGDVGWVSWGLVCGNAFESFTGIVYQTGFRRPAANYLAVSLGGSAVSQ